MAVVQEAFDIPADIMTKILTGEYRRIGGVVRYAVGPKKGQIVKHLKPVDVKVAEEAQGMGAAIVKYAKNNKKALLICAGAAAVITGGATIYHKVKSKEPEVVIMFRSALKTYIDAIRTGGMDVEIIDRLMKTLDAVKKHKDYEKFSIQLSTEDLGVLVSKIYDYTIKLAEDNSVDLSDEEKEKSEDAIIELEKYLKAQKRIFEMAA